jgi:iron(III) transport system substrate-binding protein
MLPASAKAVHLNAPFTTKWWQVGKIVIALAPMMTFAGCFSSSRNEVVVYSALDKEFSHEILQQFEQGSGIDVLPKYDVESNKTVGLVNDIINHQDRQRADVFWNNEILHTLRLRELGLLEPYRSPKAIHYPSQFVSDDGTWHGFAARARVLIVNTSILPNEAERPSSVLDLADPKWKGKCAMARPLFGTTATHAAVLFASWGTERAESFFSQVAENAVVESGNKQVAINVARGRYAFGLTDTDDAVIEIERGAPVVLVFPDQGPDQCGALLIPNTLCILKSGPNTETAKQLVDYLLDAGIEMQLAAGRSAQIPLNSQAKIHSRIEPPSPLKMMPVDFQAAAQTWSSAMEFLQQQFPLGQ